MRFGARSATEVGQTEMPKAAPLNRFERCDRGQLVDLPSELRMGRFLGVGGRSSLQCERVTVTGGLNACTNGDYEGNCFHRSHVPDRHQRGPGFPQHRVRIYPKIPRTFQARDDPP